MTNAQAAICSRAGFLCSAVTFLPARSGGSARGGMGVLAGSASVATRSEIKLRMMSAVSIAWWAGQHGSECRTDVLFQLERDGRMVSAGINITEKHISFRDKAVDQKCGMLHPATSQD